MVPDPQTPEGGDATVSRTWHEGLTFSGTGGEYFGIWIVNILLSMATLGIYSAWAKVRRMQFFYRTRSWRVPASIITRGRWRF